jgi:hypothetical protein
MCGITDSRLSRSGIVDFALLFLKPESNLLVRRSWQLATGGEADPKFSKLPIAFWLFRTLGEYKEVTVYPFGIFTRRT